MEEEERPFKLPRTVQNGTSDLLDRVAMFLPQIQQANQRLQANQDSSTLEEDQPKIDAGLEHDGGPDEADDSGDDEDSEEGSAIVIIESGREAKPALGTTVASATPDNKLDAAAETSAPSKETAPMIQIHLAVGKLDENPAIEWLAGDNDAVPSDGSNGSGDEEENEEDSCEESSSTRGVHQMVLLGSDQKMASRGPLITEL